jgi:DNA-binding beta-propeller fold protein YncE
VDHLSTLEPEAIAITENNKKILLGICNKLFILNEYGDTLRTIPLTPSIRGIALAKKSSKNNIAYVSHDEMVSMIDIDNGQTLDSVKGKDKHLFLSEKNNFLGGILETDSAGDSGTFLPLGIDTDNINGNVYVCDYRNACVIKFDEKLEFQTQWRIYNHSDRYDEGNI